MQCQNCNQPIPKYGKLYCGSSCAQIVNNKRRLRKPQEPCGICGEPVKERKNKYCSRACAGVALGIRRTMPRRSIESKVCLGCGEEKEAAEYSPHTQAVDGLHTQCKMCKAAWATEKRKRLLAGLGKKAAAKYSRTQSLKRFHGISYEAYAVMLKSQGGGCAICGGSKRLVVDHDHATGKIRGVLCNKCNLGIGHLEDDLARVRLAADYLEKTS